MTKIMSLTEEQKARIPEWVEKYTKIGLSTEPADRPRAEAAIHDLYAMAKLDPPKTIIWVPSPMTGGLAAPTAVLVIDKIRKTKGGEGRAVDGAVDDAVDDAVYGAVRGAVYGAVDDAVDGAVYGAVDGAVDGAVRGAVYGAVRGAVYGAVDDAVRGAVDDAVDGAVYGAVDDAVRDAVDDAVYGAVRGAVDDAVDGAVYGAKKKNPSIFWHYWYGGQFWSSFTAWATFFRDVVGVNVPIKAFEQLSDSAGYIWPSKDFCMVSERPRSLKLNERGRLNNDGDMAIKWPDGWGLYMMNGVRMKPEYVINPAYQITPEIVLAERNVDQRRELIRKVGVSRMAHAGKLIEESNGYQLLDMAPVFQGINYAPHLLMKNPSVPDTYHLEGVGPECKTVQQAINWRGGDINVPWEPESLN